MVAEVRVRRPTITAGEKRMYKSWYDMHRRCKDPKDIGYKNYGGRGISVSAEFDTYERFKEALGDCPEGFTLDRIDVNGNYCPGNVRWASKKTQLNNTRRTRLLTHDGVTKSCSDWAEHLGIPYQRIKNRLHSGWSAEGILSIDKLVPKRGRRIC